jgi:hypothetical protein
MIPAGWAESTELAGGLGPLQGPRVWGDESRMQNSNVGIHQQKHGRQPYGHLRRGSEQEIRD